MLNTDFTHWCHSATAQIKYKPDREAVAEELQAHMEDHYDALIAKGLSSDEASQQTLAAMGSAEEIAPQLAEIHKPWLGYIYAIVRSVAIIVAAFFIFYATTAAWPLVYKIAGAGNFDSLPKNHGPLDHYCYPNVSDRSDGRYYQVTEAGYSEAASELYLEIQVIYWPHLRNVNGFDDFWAVDSLGNYYASRRESAYDNIPKVTSGGSSSSSCIGHYNMKITQFDCDAAWVELHYDRDGRDIVLRVDLTGGGEDGTT